MDLGLSTCGGGRACGQSGSSAGIPEAESRSQNPTPTLQPPGSAARGRGTAAAVGPCNPSGSVSPGPRSRCFDLSHMCLLCGLRHHGCSQDVPGCGRDGFLFIVGRTSRSALAPHPAQMTAHHHTWRLSPHPGNQWPCSVPSGFLASGVPWPAWGEQGPRPPCPVQSCPNLTGFL